MSLFDTFGIANLKKLLLEGKYAAQDNRLLLIRAQDNEKIAFDSWLDSGPKSTTIFNTLKNAKVLTERLELQQREIEITIDILKFLIRETIEGRQ